MKIKLWAQYIATKLNNSGEKPGSVNYKTNDEVKNPITRLLP